ncbi:MAG: hypothetical protein PVF70_05335 [Anaerolineales bacterium]|jgi:hypothetical protein
MAPVLLVLLAGIMACNGSQPTPDTSLEATVTAAAAELTQSALDPQVQETPTVEPTLSALEVDGAIEYLEQLPASVVPNESWESDTVIYLFREQDHQVLPVSLATNISTAGSYVSEEQLQGGLIPAGTTVTSYLFHFDTVGTETGVTLTGCVRFPEAIIGVIVLDYDLSISDGIVGAQSVIYPGEVTHRGLELTGIQDEVDLSAREICLSLFTKQVTDQLRVITGDVQTEDPPADYLGDDNYVQSGPYAGYYRVPLVPGDKRVPFGVPLQFYYSWTADEREQVEAFLESVSASIRINGIFWGVEDKWSAPIEVGDKDGDGDTEWRTDFIFARDPSTCEMAVPVEVTRSVDTEIYNGTAYYDGEFANFEFLLTIGDPVAGQTMTITVVNNFTEPGVSINGLSISGCNDYISVGRLLEDQTIPLGGSMEFELPLPPTTAVIRFWYDQPQQSADLRDEYLEDGATIYIDPGTVD